ncbi:shikimate dehydrogenase [Microbacterium trichothecenolyticum]|uniref:shikimate dehydrogenase family protein n=1 Tax=Microbacterium trichothecenolyticum TaxID=69370 RepID=UPI001C6EC8B2|nr:shikimate dehydrogenase [Microbacterium trichothecenolyticum]MBW9121748.1 shikimate dehydrogenase [Microbacterium trichothecenolyticum]
MTSTFTFFGVTTGSSAIRRIFPLWMEELGIDSQLVGLDFPVDAPAADYRRAVAQIKGDPDAVGGLITTHKLNVLAAARDLFDDLDDSAQLLKETSCIHKDGERLLGAALDDRTSLLGLDALVGQDYWKEDHDLVLLGAGGASIALTLGLHRAARTGRAMPSRVVVTARSQPRLDEMRELHHRIGFGVPIDYVIAGAPEEADRVVAASSRGSVIVNATGMGKDRPGSPLSPNAPYPPQAVLWDMNYRGELKFLADARESPRADLRVVDGWDYFVYSWTKVVAVVYGIDIPVTGPRFDRLSHLARTA